MKKFIIAIEELVAQNFEVWAEDSREALAIAEEKYQSGKFVLESGEVQFRQMASVGDEPTEWKKFHLL